LPLISRTVWSVDRLPYKLFAFAAFAHYVFALLAMAGAIATSLIAIGILTYNKQSLGFLGIPVLLQVSIQLAMAALSWAIALAFRLLREIIRDRLSGT
jgi:hypothetical protein